MPGRTPIPRLTPTANGFGGFTSNPSIPYPGGRVLTSDVNDAGNTLNFEGTPSQRFNPTPFPSPSPSPTPTGTPSFPVDPSGAGLVGPEIRDFYNRSYDRRFWHGDPNSDPSGTVGVEPGVDYTYAGPGGKPPGITMDPNEDWTGTTPSGGPTVDLFKAAPGSGGVPVWWDTNNYGSNRIGPQPWWMGFNPSLGNDFHANLTGPGFDNNYDTSGTATISGGPPPALGPNEAWVDLGDSYSGGVSPPDQTDPGFVDPGSGLGPTDQGSSTSGGNRGITVSGTVPSSGLTIVGYDSNNHQPIYRDQNGNLFVNPGTGTAYGGMDQSTRFANNGVTGNYTADKTSDAFVAAGGYVGAPNRWSPDFHDTFTPGSAGAIDPETGLARRVDSSVISPFTVSQKSGAPPLRLGDPASTAAYNAWLMQQPEYKAFMQRMLPQQSGTLNTGSSPRGGSGRG